MPVPVSNIATMLGALEHAKLTPQGGGTALDFGFNPASLTVSRTAQWRAASSRNTTGGRPSLAGSGGSGGGGAAAALGAASSAMSSALGGGGSAPAPVVAGHGPNSYRGSQPGNLSMDVYFNDSFSLAGLGDVSGHIATLESWMHIPQDGPNPQPPLLVFSWGKLRFVGYMTALTVAYLHFGIDGSPIHAKASIRMQEEPDQQAAQNPTSGGPAGRRTRRVAAGDSLHSIAYREYGSPTRWRTLAEANGIDDPLRLDLGRVLLIPDAPDGA